MKILFWNLAKHNLSKYIKEILAEQDIDVAIFAEHSGVDFRMLCEKVLNGKYVFIEGYGNCEKIRLIAKYSIKVSVRREDVRYSISSVSILNQKYIVAGVHLPAKPYASPSDREIPIQEMLSAIQDVEKEVKHSRTIVMGDFNCSPFDVEMISKNKMNVVLFKKLINKAEIVTCNRRQYKRFYNPIIEYLTEKDESYGSYYYAGNAESLYWYCYDQLLVRKALANDIQNVYFCKRVGNTNLIKNLRPNSAISDHLPIIGVINGRT